MKKENLMAIFFGLFLGLVFSLFLINQSKNQKETQIKTIKKEQKTFTPSIKIPETPYLEILEPKDNFIVNTSHFKIKGKANKNHLVLLISPIKELIFENKNENFEIDLPLALGENSIQISLYPKNKSIPLVTKTINIYYLPKND